jgi:hypothetical protein
MVEKAETKKAVTKQPAKSEVDKAEELLDKAIGAFEDLGGDIWPVVVSRLAAIRVQVEKHK